MIGVGRDVDREFDAPFLSADRPQYGCIFHDLRDRQHPTVDLSPRDKFPQPPDNSASPQALGHAFRQRFPEKLPVLGQVSIHHIPRRREIIGDRGQRLVDFMGKRRRQCADRAQARGMGQIRLQRLQLRFRLVFFGQIDDEAGKIPLFPDLRFPDFQLQRKGRAVLPASDNGTANTDNPLFSGLEISLHIAVMCGLIWFWHQDFDILTNDLCLLISEHFFGRGAERADQASLVNHHHGVRDGRQDRFQYGIGLIQLVFGTFERRHILKAYQDGINFALWIGERSQNAFCQF